MSIKHLLVVLICSLITNVVLAQNFSLDTIVNRQQHLYAEGYNKAIGVKMFPGAISYKKFTKQNKAYEAIGYITLDGLSLSIVKEFYAPIVDVDQLTWFYGYGGHLGIWSDEFKRTNLGTSNSNIAVGFDGIIGLDYKIKNSPINLSFDWQPSFSIIQAYFKNQGGIGVRYTF
jgi:hypothetical protein